MKMSINNGYNGLWDDVLKEKSEGGNTPLNFYNSYPQHFDVVLVNDRKYARLKTNISDYDKDLLSKDLVAFNQDHPSKFNYLKINHYYKTIELEQKGIYRAAVLPSVDPLPTLIYIDDRPHPVFIKDKVETKEQIFFDQPINSVKEDLINKEVEVDTYKSSKIPLIAGVGVLAYFLLRD